jgi:hypothetical protein
MDLIRDLDLGRVHIRAEYSGIKWEYTKCGRAVRFAKEQAGAHICRECLAKLDDSK